MTKAHKEMTKKEIAKTYISHLENGKIKQVIALFTQNGIVESPLYGIKKASDFYLELSNDTTNSELSLLGIFEEQESNTIALYFTYKWTLKNNQIVKFDVVDIIEFDNDNKISKLKIIYDTVIARKLVEQL
ncbi:nuclear transport factor 2 family protein [uncultured Tenacibaculum sp.]|uniref:nuclear transport factor 2 family protein n=1 Tax=uncultured Tenacibaculum sp. TaxID=174713 RepID=UPI00262BE1D4|nr:nuclear transport factor 2 family protein [uncultured Tenacibaculum sp.]